MIRDREGALKQLEARNKALADLAARQAAHDELVRQHNALHAQSQSPEERAAAAQKHAADDYAKYANAGRYMGDSVEYSDDVNKLFERLIFLDADPDQAAAAAELEKSGESEEQIWKKKGAFKDPYTGKWTKEISDKEMDIPGFKSQMSVQSKKVPYAPAQTAIKHDKLFKNVPGVKSTQVSTQSITPIEKVFGNVPYSGIFRSGSSPSLRTLSVTKKGALDTTVHELQHNVDFLQGNLRKPGYDTASFSQSKASNLMRHSVDPNEIRANAAMSRRELDDKQRQERFPLKDYKLGGSIFGGKFGVPVSMVPKSLREMQLVGTDEYRQHAIAVTPGQDQEIENAFPFDEYGVQNNELPDEEQTENVTNESNGEMESSDRQNNDQSFKSIRKRLKEQEEYEEETEETEEEVDEPEDDGAEDGIDFTPNLKTKKLRKTGPVGYAASDMSGLPVLTTGANMNENLAEGILNKIKNILPQKKVAAPAVKAKPTNILKSINRNAGKISTGTAAIGAASKALTGDLSGAATDVAVQTGQEAAGKLATKGAAKLVSKFASKAVARKLPLGLGLAATGAGVADRLKSKDYLGAAGEGLSGLAGTIPGVGTAVSAGIDTALLGRDLKNLQAQTQQQKKKTTLAEAVDYHQQNNISLVENVYRPGSDMFFAMLFEAKRLYSEGSYTPKDEYEQDLLESDIGEVAEYEGQPVVLDFPFEEDLEECWKGYTQKGMKKKGDKMVPNCVPMNEEGDPTKGKGIGKPFRSGGGGAVYVRSGKGNIIKVNFSQSGMRKRINEPARVRSFMARHHCLTNKDRTSASYWACRWPRYFSNTGQRWW